MRTSILTVTCDVLTCHAPQSYTGVRNDASSIATNGNEDPEVSLRSVSETSRLPSFRFGKSSDRAQLSRRFDFFGWDVTSLNDVQRTGTNRSVPRVSCRRPPPHGVRSYLRVNVERPRQSFPPLSSPTRGSSPYLNVFLI